MIRRLLPALLAVGLAGLAAAAALWYARSRPLPVPRNVLLITLDTLRADRLGCYGSTLGLTRNLDALAADAVVFERAYTPVPLTGPSHATMLTGRYPIAHGLRNNGTEVLPSREILVSEILKERGFATAAIVSALVLASTFGLNQGFDLYHERDISGTDKGHGLWFDQRRGDKTVDRALSWLKAEGERPFFLWVHLFDPHDPYDPPSPWKETYKETPYNGEVAFTDAQVGRLLDQVREQGLYDDTLIIVAGDHGEGLGDHKELFHAVFLYDTTTHVPLIVRAPGGRRGARVADLASTIDITPTILDALRIDPPGDAPPMQGVSLLAAAGRGGRVPARPIFLETIYPSASYGWATARALVKPSWKMIDLPGRELYDLAADPGEQNNLWGAQPARAAEMAAEYEQVAGEMEALARAVETAQIDDETRDRLISLGYIGGQQSASTGRRGPDPKQMAFMIIPLNIANELMRKKEYSDAAEVYAKALERDPENRIALLNMARSLAGMDRLDEAIPYFERAVAAYPDVEEFYRVYGGALLKAGRAADALALFRRGSEKMPESAHLHFMQGAARFRMRDWDGALPELELATRLAPRFSKPYYLMAVCTMRLGDQQASLGHLEEFLRRDRDVDTLFADPDFAELRSRPAFQEMVKRYL